MYKVCIWGYCLLIDTMTVCVETVGGDKLGAHDCDDCVYGTRVDYMMISAIAHSTSHRNTLRYTYVDRHIHICSMCFFRDLELSPLDNLPGM